MTKRSIFKRLLASLAIPFDVKAFPSLNPKGPVISNPNDYPFGSDEHWRRSRLPILHMIGTGTPPAIEGEFQRVIRPQENSITARCIIGLVGWNGAHVVHLYGNWMKLIPQDTFLMVWKTNLCKNAVGPRLFLDGVEYLVIGPWFLPKAWCLPQDFKPIAFDSSGQSGDA